MSNPKISIIIPTYAPNHFLYRALTNLLKSRRPSIEILVVDDGSPEPFSLPVKDPRVRLVRYETNRGPAHAMNVGIEQAKGEYLTFLDQDDLPVPQSLNWRASWMHEHPRAEAFMGTLAGIVDPSDVLQTQLTNLLRHRTQQLPTRFSFSFLTNGGWVPLSPLSLCLFKRTLIHSVGHLEEGLTRTHDREYLYRIVQMTEIPIVQCPVLFYRLHETNLSVDYYDEKIIPNERTRAELYLINQAYEIPYPA